MYRTIYAIMLASTLGFIFCYWAFFTPEGRSQYDEMAGIIPMSVFFISSISLFVCFVVLAIDAIKKLCQKSSLK